MFLQLVCLLCFLGGTAADAALAQAAAAQSTSEPASRADALRLERVKKQQALTPNKPDSLQHAIDFAEVRALRILGRDGLYPKIGTLTTGSGFAFGGGYRSRAMFAHHGRGEVWGAASIKGYWALQGRVAFPERIDDWYMVEAIADVRDYPKEKFYGLGPDSSRDNEVTFDLHMSEFTSRAGVRPAPALLVGGEVGLFYPRLDLVDIDYLRTGAFVEVDYREPKNARRGGWYRLNFGNYDDRTTGRRGFQRADLDVRQFIGFLSDKRVIALRGFVSTSDSEDDGPGIPFFLMPSLGGNDTLRGFRNYRFRGPHAILVQGEYRWELWSGLDAALFYDAGKVALQRADINFKDLESDYGFGFRFNTAGGVIMRVDAAFGSREGKHLLIVFGGVF